MALSSYPEPVIREKDIARFWSKARIRDAGRCWPWIGGHKSKGYGCFHFRYPKDMSIGAHRVAMLLATGTWSNLCVLHSCDNPNCVNPHHLRYGTDGDNNRDRHAKGRSSRSMGLPGERNPHAKITDAQAENIMSRFRSGESAPSLARSFSVSTGIVYSITSGRRWKHITEVKEV